MIQISQDMYNKLIADYKVLDEENERLKRQIQALENEKVMAEGKYQEKLKRLYTQVIRGVD